MKVFASVYRAWRATLSVPFGYSKVVKGRCRDAGLPPSELPRGIGRDFFWVDIPVGSCSDPRKELLEELGEFGVELISCVEVDASCPLVVPVPAPV